jgi:hypothetical protein
MSGTDSGGFRFVSHQRRGLIALPGVAAAGTVSASAVLSDGSSTTPVTLGLASVADVQGIDTTLITRQYPRPGATDAETEFFPLVEFAVPELPWLLPTPAGPAGPLPWLCLVVVQDRDGVSISGSGLGKPDVLHIGGAARPSEELPDLAGSALWAHAFAATSVHTEGTADPTENADGPALSGCRLVAPRRLQPETSYFTCVVPTLAAAALAGLGRSDQEVAAALAAPQPNYAWSVTDTSVDLPAYLHWEFSCGSGGDFESLARALHEVPVPPTFGTRPLDIGLAGAGMPETASLATVFRGALTAPGIAEQSAWPDPADTDQRSVDASLVGEVAAAASLTAAAATQLPAGRPAVGPLLYARAAAGRGNVAATDPAQDWFDQLNRDPRARAVAGLATRVLRRNVEDVMARAWQQAGQVEEANAILRRLQVSRAVTASIHGRHLSALSAGGLLSAARPLLGRAAIPASVTGGAATADALAAVAASALPAGLTWRGVVTALRPGTRLGDLAGPAAASTGAPAASTGTPAAGDAQGRLAASLAGGIAEPDILPDGTVAVMAPSAVFGAAVAGLLTDGLRAAAAAANLDVPATGANAATVAAGLDALATGAGRLSTQAATSLAAETGAVINTRPLPPTVTLAQIGGVLVSQSTVRATAPAGPVLVHIQPGPQVATVLTPQASASALAPGAGGTTDAATALARAAQEHLATLPAPHAVPVGTIPIGPGPVPGRPVSAAPVVTPPVGTTPVSTTPIVTQPVGTIPVGTIPVGTIPVGTIPVGTIPVGTIPVTAGPVVLQLPGTDPRLALMRSAYAAAADRFVRAGMSATAPPAGELDLGGVRTALLASLHPAKTVATLAAGRVPSIAGLTRPDPVAPVMAGPVFTEAAYTALAVASHDAFVPGLDSIPPDSVTLMQTNPGFIAAYLAGLNSALGHELLWRGYPTDERGTYWHSFWGAAPEIGPLHLFHGSLPDNIAQGTQPLLVLVLRGRLLSRYPDSDIYAVVASADTTAPELDDGTKITRPVFRDFMGPDITLVGFPLTYQQIVGTAGGQGYWFVVAEHPGQPRFGLTDPDPQVVHPPLPTWDELSWADLGPAAVAATYVPLAAPPMTPAGTTRRWSASAADMAAITYQPAVRVAIRARDLLGSAGS